MRKPMNWSRVRVTAEGLLHRHSARARKLRYCGMEQEEFRRLAEWFEVRRDYLLRVHENAVNEDPSVMAGEQLEIDRVRDDTRLPSHHFFRPPGVV